MTTISSTTHAKEYVGAMSDVQDRRLRVMHILHTLNAGGAEMLVKDFVEARGQGIEFSVVTLDGYGPLKRI